MRLSMTDLLFTGNRAMCSYLGAWGLFPLLWIGFSAVVVFLCGSIIAPGWGDGAGILGAFAAWPISAIVTGCVVEKSVDGIALHWGPRLRFLRFIQPSVGYSIPCVLWMGGEGWKSLSNAGWYLLGLSIWGYLPLLLRWWARRKAQPKPIDRDR